MIKNLNLYTTFMAVAKCGSVSAAARELFVSQPGLSADIRALEDELGVPLFFRTARGMTLTEEGAACLEYVKKAFGYLDSGEDMLRDITGLRAGHLRIGASDMTLRFFLLDFLVPFRSTYPDVHLSVTNAPTPKSIASLREGLIDFAVITEGALEHRDENDLVMLPVRDICDIFVCSPDFPLACEREISYSRLAQFPTVMLAGNTSTTRYVAREIKAIEPEVQITPAIEPATSDLVLEFALRGMGVASIVEDFAAPAIASGSVVKLDMAHPIPPRKMVIAYLKEPPLCTAAKKLIDVILKDQGADQPSAS